MVRSQLGHHVRGEQGRGRGFMTLVAGASTCSVSGLLERIHCQHSEADRQRVSYGHLIQASGGLSRDVVEMGSFSANDRTQGNQAGVSPGFGGCGCRTRELECTRQPYDVHLLARKSCFPTTRERAIEQLPGD